MSSQPFPSELQWVERYVRERALPLEPGVAPVPFRGRRDATSDSLPFFDELDLALRTTPGAIWNIMGAPGSGKTHFAHWAAARWGRRFLEDPEHEPAPLWINARRLQAALKDDRSMTGGPFAFAMALAFELWGETPETVARLLAKRPFILIIDKDELPETLGWKLELPMGLPPGLKILHLAIQDSLGGPCARLEHWDRETSLIAAHRRRGAEGVQCIETLAASPAAALAGYPPVVEWLLERESKPPSFAGSCDAVFEYLRHTHHTLGGDAKDFEDWCASLQSKSSVVESPALQLAARRLQLLTTPGGDWRIGLVFAAHALPFALQSAQPYLALSGRVLSDLELGVISRVPFPGDTLSRLAQSQSWTGVKRINAINICWRVGKTPVPRGLLKGGPWAGLELEGHPFPEGLEGLQLEDSNLSGITVEKEARNCRFQRCSFREASFVGRRLGLCQFSECSFEQADFSDASFFDCVFEKSNLTAGIWSGTTFTSTAFLKGVVLAATQEGDSQRFRKCTFEKCDLSRLAPTGLFLESCRLQSVRLAGQTVSRLEAADSLFERCDFLGLRALNALLKSARFEKCLLADASFRGADLRNARFVEAEFQPGPGSRAGMTDEITRTDALHGSKSGFYADDISEGVYLDPDLIRTADLRDCDLTGAVFTGTDLFRVDLRGAKMSPDLHATARRMRAILE